MTDIDAKPKKSAKKKVNILVVILILVGCLILVLAGIITYLGTRGQGPAKFLATDTPTRAATLTFTSTPTLGMGSSMLREGDGMVMVYVPAGKFMMGSEEGRFDAAPVHAVYLETYWIDQTEVTNKMYALCVSSGACDPPERTSSSTRSSYYGNPTYDDYPVIWVGWSAADTYCGWAGGRLPTEAEWEKAARGTDGRGFPWGDETPTCSLGNFDGIGDCVEDTSEVGSYPAGASPYGALDMAGNVEEWVAGWYDVYPGGDPTAWDDFGDFYGTTVRVLRGGSWLNDGIPSWVRDWVGPSASLNVLGFRCSLDTSP